MTQTITRPDHDGGDQPSPAASPRGSAGTLRSELDQMQLQIHDAIGRAQSHLDRWRESIAADWAHTPPADVEETDEAFLVEIELPGVKRSDVEIATTGRRFTVSGERREKERVGVLRRRTRVVGRFRYDLALPADVDPEGVTAGLEEGVLTVRLPKPERDRPRRVPVT